MRWASVGALLGAVLLPMASAYPCRPQSRTTTTTEASVPTATTSTASISTETSISTDSATETQSSLSTKTATTLTTLTTLTTSTLPATTTTADSTTTVTTSETTEPTPENLIENGGFEEEDISVWQERTVTIERNDPRAATGTAFALYHLVNDQASGGHQLNQTINGLDTSALYRLSFSGSILGNANFGSASCRVVARFRGNEFKSWSINPATQGYITYSVDDVAFNSMDGRITLEFRCTGGPVTVNFGIDDIVLEETQPPTVPTVPVP
ncbi:hypothetical protein ACJ41O_014533 [Fusarium nematophilum]